MDFWFYTKDFFFHPPPPLMLTAHQLVEWDFFVRAFLCVQCWIFFFPLIPAVSGILPSLQDRIQVTVSFPVY